MRTLTPADCRVMPWKNGLGKTTEIAVEPEGAAIDDFTWRVSIADVGASGPFSAFPGCDRVIVQLEGAPMTLVHDGVPTTLTRLVPHRFAGEVETVGVLESPPARDFNVMVRRDRARAEVSVRELRAGESAPFTAGDANLVHVLEGGVNIEEAGAAAAVISAGETGLWRANEAAITALGEGAIVLAIAISSPRGARVR